eukprot:2827135-Rhodomonas_salina.4
MCDPELAYASDLAGRATCSSMRAAAFKVRRKFVRCEKLVTNGCRPTLNKIASKRESSIRS